MIWRFRGSPHYLNVQGDRLGVSRVLMDRARHSPELHRVNTLLGQLATRYHQAPKNGDVAAIPPADLAQVRGTLGQCEQELQKLHALAAASQSMIDEALAAFGVEPPTRHFRVACDFDQTEVA